MRAWAETRDFVNHNQNGRTTMTGEFYDEVFFSRFYPRQLLGFSGHEQNAILLYSYILVTLGHSRIALPVLHGFCSNSLCLEHSGTKITKNIGANNINSWFDFAHSVKFVDFCELFWDKKVGYLRQTIIY
jgi:hypothetical protein